MMTYKKHIEQPRSIVDPRLTYHNHISHQLDTANGLGINMRLLPLTISISRRPVNIDHHRIRIAPIKIDEMVRKLSEVEPAKRQQDS